MKADHRCVEQTRSRQRGIAHTGGIAGKVLKDRADRFGKSAASRPRQPDEPGFVARTGGRGQSACHAVAEPLRRFDHLPHAITSLKQGVNETHIVESAKKMWPSSWLSRQNRFHGKPQ